MTSINSAYSGSYYQLNGQNTQNSGALASSTTSLLSALNGASHSDNSDTSAYTLDLSAAAQQYLSGNSNPASSVAGNDSFVLSTSQQKTLTSILVKYKDAPYTQATFNKIQDELTSVGLGSSQLSRQDQIKSFNPTEILINDLSGNFSSTAGSASAATEQAKSSSYMNMVIGQWKSLSTTVNTTTISA